MFSHCFFRQTRPFGREEQMYSINEKFCKEIVTLKVEDEKARLYIDIIYIYMYDSVHIHIYYTYMCIQSHPLNPLVR